MPCTSAPRYMTILPQPREPTQTHPHVNAFLPQNGCDREKSFGLWQAREVIKRGRARTAQAYHLNQARQAFLPCFLTYVLQNHGFCRHATPFFNLGSLMPRSQVIDVACLNISSKGTWPSQPAHHPCLLLLASCSASVHATCP